MGSGEKPLRKRLKTAGRPSGGAGRHERAWVSALSVLLCMLVLFTAAGCGGMASPAGKVVEGFFNAVRDENPASVRALLDTAVRAEFEAAMSDAELTDHLSGANAALEAQYGKDWRKKLKVLSARKGEAGENGISWSVTVSLGPTEGDRQVVPVLEKDGAFWLDLSWVVPDE